MACLRELLQSHGSLLLLDAASSRIQVGLLRRDEKADWATSSQEAGVGLFQCLQDLSIDPMKAPALVFCEGPGSILGIRTSAMTIRAWEVLCSRPVYRYGSLALVVHALNRPGAKVIADARRDRWHCQMQGQPLRRVATAELTGDLYQPEGFRHWSTPPDGVQATSYNLAELLPPIPEADIFTLTTEPDAFLHEEPSYKTWTPQIHRAP